MAKNYPELLYAYIPICPMIDQLESEKIILKAMKEKASKNGNEKALQELNQVKVPFENGSQLYFHRKWVLEFMGSKAKITEKQVQEWALMWLPIFNEASKIIYSNAHPRFDARSIFLWVEKMSRRTQVLRRNTTRYWMPLKRNYIGSSAQAIRCRQQSQTSCKRLLLG